MGNFYAELEFYSNEELNYFQGMLSGILELMNENIRHPNEAKILASIKEKYNVNLSPRVFRDESYLAYPSRSYNCETNEDLEYYYIFDYYVRDFPANKKISFHSSLEDVIEPDSCCFGLIIQSFFRKFRPAGFFSARFTDGFLIVTSEMVKFHHYDELIENERKLHEKYVSG
jgi:hypothetical protein